MEKARRGKMKLDQPAMPMEILKCYDCPFAPDMTGGLCKLNCEIVITYTTPMPEPPGHCPLRANSRLVKLAGAKTEADKPQPIMENVAGGLTPKAYAAIHLCVPDSGDEQLDAMIRMAQRERLAGQMMTGILLAPDGGGEEARENPQQAAKWAIEQADALIAAGEMKK
jgi:hypothetical protein